MRRREFIKAIASAATAWPLAARAQQGDRMRRIGVLMNLGSDDPQSKVRIAAFIQGLQQSGWIDRSNVRIETRWSAGNLDLARRYATELVTFTPDVILADGGTTMGPLQQVTRTVPLVFVNVVDPVAAGFVDSLARPGGNASGFTLFEYAISAKWLELLKEIAPAVTQVAVFYNPALASGRGQLGEIQAAASSFRMELRPIDVRDTGEIERPIAAFARSSNSGLLVTANSLADLHREVIITLAARFRLPAVYPFRYYAMSGGLISYGPDLVDPYRRAAAYVDRILKGDKPADLPVQNPTKYELFINLKTAKALGLTVPATVLARADEVIE
jgi:putative tryptophan/tyrosine transport system substrate-binding protein